MQTLAEDDVVGGVSNEGGRWRRPVAQGDIDKFAVATEDVASAAHKMDVDSSSRSVGLLSAACKADLTE